MTDRSVLINETWNEELLSDRSYYDEPKNKEPKNKDYKINIFIYFIYTLIGILLVSLGIWTYIAISSNNLPNTNITEPNTTINGLNDIMNR